MNSTSLSYLKETQNYFLFEKPHRNIKDSRKYKRKKASLFKLFKSKPENIQSSNIGDEKLTRPCRSRFESIMCIFLPFTLILRSEEQTRLFFRTYIFFVLHSFVPLSNLNLPPPVVVHAYAKINLPRVLRAF